MRELCLPLAVDGSLLSVYEMDGLVRMFVSETKQKPRTRSCSNLVGFACNLVRGGYVGPLLFLGRYRGFWVRTSARSSRSFREGAVTRTWKQYHTYPDGENNSASDITQPSTRTQINDLSKNITYFGFRNRLCTLNFACP